MLYFCIKIAYYQFAFCKHRYFFLNTERHHRTNFTESKFSLFSSSHHTGCNENFREKPLTKFSTIVLFILVCNFVAIERSDDKLQCLTRSQ